MEFSSRRVCVTLSAALDAGEELDQLGVDGRVVRAHRLEADLPELAVAPLLRRRVPEHRPDVVGLHGLRLPVQAVLEVGARDGRRSLGPQSQRALAPVLERVHLLVHDVRAGAGRAREELGVLERGRDDEAVAVQVRGFGGRAQHGPAARLVGGKDVERPARRLDPHGASARSSARNGFVMSSWPERRRRAVAGVDNGLGRQTVDEQADRGQQSFPVRRRRGRCARRSRRRARRRRRAQPSAANARWPDRVAGHPQRREVDSGKVELLLAFEQHLGRVTAEADVDPVRDVVARPLQSIPLERGHVDARAGRLDQLDDTSDVVEIAVRHEDGDAPRAPQCRLDALGLAGPARIDDDRLVRARAPDHVAVGLERAQGELLDFEGHRGRSLAASRR